MLGQYTTIPNALFLDERLPRNCIVIYGVLQAHAGTNGAIYPSYETIAKEAGLNRATVIRLMKRLILYKYVAKARGTFKGGDKQASNYYYLNPNPALLIEKLSTNYPHQESQSATHQESQSATPNNNRNEFKKCARNSDYYKLPIHAHAYEFPAGVGVGGGRQSLCVNDNEIIGQSGTKKLESAFDSSDATHFVENYSAKKERA